MQGVIIGAILAFLTSILILDAEDGDADRQRLEIDSEGWSTR